VYVLSGASELFSSSSRKPEQPVDVTNKNAAAAVANIFFIFKFDYNVRK